MLHIYLFQVIFALLCPLLVLKIVFYDEENHRWSVPFWKKLAIFYNAPISKFWAHLVRKPCLVRLMKVYRIIGFVSRMKRLFSFGYAVAM